MTLGLAERQGKLGNVAVPRCEAELPKRSIYRLLHAERDRLFPDELFADLYVKHGRRSIPPSILAVVMVLQRLEGCSNREPVDRFAYDLRWRYAAGVDDAAGSFAHTVLVELRARLRASADPDRVFRVTTKLARQVGLVGVWRVLDSAPLFDAVATQDTVTLLRGAIRGLLRACSPELAAAMAAALLADLPAPSAGNAPAAAEAAAGQAVATEQAPAEQVPIVYGDAAYGTGALLAELDHRGVTAMTKVATPTAPAGHFTKQQFRIDLDAGTVTCPAKLQVSIIPARQGGRWLASAAPAWSAHCKPPAPAARPGGPSPSTRRRHGCRRPDTGSVTRPGEPTTVSTGRS
jgi:Transposase domain (DUF772)